MKLRLARLGPDGKASGPILFAFGYAAPREDQEEEHDRRVMSFLRDLQSLMLEPPGDGPAIDPRATKRMDEEGNALLWDSVSGTFGPHHELDQTTLQVLSEWRRVLEAEHAFIWLRDHDLLKHCPAVDGNLPSTETQSAWRAFARRLSESLERSGQEALLESLEEEHPVASFLEGAVDCFAVPIRFDGATRGVLCGLHRGFRDSFRPTEVRLLKALGSQLALLVAHSQAYENLQTFLKNTVRTLVAAIDAKDPFTGGHSERVSIISMLLGHELELDLEDLEALYWAALLHDVGKIGMPESVLRSVGPLDEKESAVFEQHPERGWELLHPILQLRRAAEGVRHHHERWDGEGYPMRLTGSEIPIIARIIAVADAFDSILTRCKGSDEHSVRQAVESIDADAGLRYDSEVVAALRRLSPLLVRHQWVLVPGRKLTHSIGS